MYALVLSVCLAAGSTAAGNASCTQVQFRSEAVFLNEADCNKAGADFWTKVKGGTNNGYPNYYCDGPH